jgi:hypothetical protein
MSYGHDGFGAGGWSNPHGAGLPQYPSAPPNTPTPVSAPARQKPGWLSRSLFWTALIIGALPSLVLVPMVMSGGAGTAGGAVYSLGSVAAAILRLTIGTVAIVLVKNTNWPRRIIGAAIFVVGCLIPMVLNPLLSMFLGMSGFGTGESIQTVSIVEGVLSTLYLAAVFCGWNIVRNRRWWIVVIAAVIAVLMNVGSMLFNLALISRLPSGAMTTVTVQAVWFILEFGVLGLCHLLGRVRGGTVPPPSRDTVPQPHPHQWNQLPNYPGNRPPY